MTHICVSDLTIIGSNNGLSPGRRQAIIRTNVGILLIRPVGTNFSEIVFKILIFPFKKMRLKISSAKRRSFCLCLNVLIITRNWSLGGVEVISKVWFLNTCCGLTRTSCEIALKWMPQITFDGKSTLVLVMTLHGLREYHIQGWFQACAQPLQSNGFSYWLGANLESAEISYLRK